MVRYKFKDKLRHFAKRIPFSEDIYNYIFTAIFPKYTEDGMRVNKNIGFTKDPDFLRAYSATLKQDPKIKIRWRAHVCQWAGYHASKLDGDFVEAGVNTALLTTSVIEYINFKTITNKKFYLFDTFEGLVDDLILPEEHDILRHNYSDCYDFIVDTFKNFKNVVIVKGIVPYSLSDVKIDKVAYLSIDMNCAKPEIATLEFFWDKIVHSGIVILDDYCFSGRQIQKQYADEFAKKINVKILSLPTGQGMIIK